MNCTSCGAPIEAKNRFSKVLVCEYCGTHLQVKENGFDEKGKYPKLVEFPSIFSVGARGTILGKPISVLGRMRYKYDGGHYDEWFVDYDGGTAWVTEDEGTFTLFTEMVEAVDLTDIDSIRAGQMIQVGDMNVMVKEVGEAVVEGGEGELLFYVEPGSEIVYIDGIADGKKISIESTPEEVELFIGRPLMNRDIVVEG